jgi:hypothetical protein
VLAGATALSLCGWVAEPALGASPPVTPDPGAAVADSGVNEMAAAGATTYIAGPFTRIGTPTGDGLLFDSATGAHLSFPAFDGQVLSAIPDGSGGWYVGGSFDLVGGFPRVGLAHVRANLGIDPAFPQLGEDPYGQDHSQATVTTLSLSSDGKTLYVGGYFDRLGGQPRASLAAIDTATGAVTAWNPQLSSSSQVNSIAVGFGPAAGYVFVGGGFTQVGSANISDLAKIAVTDGAPDTSFSPAPSYNGSSLGATVDALALNSTGSLLYSGGYFDTIGGAARGNLARLATSGGSEGTADSWNPDADGQVNSIALTAFGLTVFVGGDFSDVGGQTRWGVAALSPANGAATPWQASLNAGGTVQTVALTSNGLLIAGTFFQVGAVSRPGVAVLNVGSGAVTSFDPPLAGFPWAAAAAGSHVLIGGAALLAGGVTRDGLAALDPSGRPTAFAPQINGFVSALAVSPDARTVYIGGSFTTVDGQPRNRLAAFDVATGALTPWQSTLSDLNPHAVAVEALAVSRDGKSLFVGGRFDHLGTDSQPRSNLGAVSTADGKATAWLGGVTGGSIEEIRTLALSHDGATLYVGGGFTTAGANSAPRENLAALTTAPPGNATGWAPNPTGGFGSDVNSIAVTSQGTVYIAGDFVTAGTNSQPRDHLAAIAPSGAATAWAPSIATSDPLNHAYALAVALAADERTVFVAGRFDHIAGQPRSGLAELSTATGTPTPWAPDVTPYDRVHALLVANGAVRVGGEFDRIGSVGSQAYAQFTYLPSVIAPPRVMGKAVYRHKLTCGGWKFASAPPVAYGIRWLRGRHPISGATKATYVVKAGDSGRAIACMVTAANATGPVSARSRAVFPVPFILSFTRKRVKGGLRLSFKITEKAHVTIVIERSGRHGHKVAERLRLKAHPGSNTVKAAGGLVKGHYRAVISARDARGGRSNTRTVSLSIP